MGFWGFGVLGFWGFGVLEASDMLVYNFYGAYQDLYTAYDKVRETLKAQQLSQSGPAREFYVTDPSREKDPKNWLTRIMVPVTAAKKAPL
jgi:effector-binding domain-containing protein